MTTVSILHITTKLVKPLQNNLTTSIYSLVNGLYSITTKSIKLILNVEQFGGVKCSNLIVPTDDVATEIVIYKPGTCQPQARAHLVS